jgi:FMN phosphatase YigB (HAD superfamily)
MTSSLVVFDLGRVLVHICDSWAEAWQVAALDGPAPDPGDAREALSKKVHDFEIGAITADQFAIDAAALLGRSPSQVHRVLDIWVRGTTPGALRLLEDLAARGHAIACLSNTNARHWSIMQGWQGEQAIFAHLGLPLGSHELRLRKPDPAIYAALEARSGHVGPKAGDIVFFDDLPENVDAARARGWRAVEVRDRQDPVAEMRAWLRQAELLP